MFRKAWLDTRARFAIGLAVLHGMAALLIGIQSRTHLGPGGVQDAWLFQALPQLWCLFAIVLGSGGLLSQAARGGGLFTLSLPVTRQRVVLSRVAMVLLELWLLALLPALSFTLYGAAIWGTFFSADVVVLAFSLWLGGAIFFAIPFFLSSLVETFWVPVVAMLGTAIVITVIRDFNPDFGRYTLRAILTGGDYFHGGSLPWLGLIASAAMSTALVALATRNIARRDF